MKKSRMYLIIIAAMLLTGCGRRYTVGQPENTDAAKKKEEQKANGNSEETIYDFWVQIDDEILQLPMSLAELEEMGYTPIDLENMKLQPREIVSDVQYKKEQSTVYIQIYNRTPDVQDIKECSVGGILIQAEDVKDSKVLLPKKIELGVTSEESVQELYGAPTNTYEMTDEVQFSYEKDAQELVRLNFDRQIGALQKLDIRSFKMDEVSAEDIQESTVRYIQPNSLGEDIQSGTVKLDGILYHIPVPVSEFTAHGWSMQESAHTESVEAEGTSQIFLTKGVYILQVPVLNDTEKVKLLKDCVVTKLVADQTEETARLELPSGITMRMPEEELLEILDNTEYTVENMETVTCYIISDSEYHIEILTDREKKDVTGISIRKR